MRNCGSLTRKKMGLSSKLNVIDTKIGSCFPIQFTSFVVVSSTDGMQIDSNSKIATFWNKVFSLIYSIMNTSIFLNEVSVKCKHSLDKCFRFGLCNKEDDG